MSTSNFKLGAFQLSRLCQFGISRSPGHQTRPTAEHRHRKQDLAPPPTRYLHDVHVL